MSHGYCKDILTFRLTMNEIKPVKNTYAPDYNSAIFQSGQSSTQVSQTSNVPTFVLPVDRQSSLRVDNPVIVGQGAPKSLITVFADGKVVGTGRVDDVGNWAILTDTLSSGLHSFAVSQENSAGTLMSETIKAAVNVSSGGLKFSIASLFADGVSADRTYLQNMLDDTGARLSEFVDADLTIGLTVSVKDLGGASGSAAARWLGVDSHGTPRIDSALLNLGSQYADSYTKTDYSGPYLFAHEMMHVLGFNYYVPNFQKYVKVEGDKAYFVGPNSVMLNGGAVPLDSSLSHLVGNHDLMGSGGVWLDNPDYDATSPYAPYSQLDIAMLKDLGWTTKPVLVSADGHTFIAGSGKVGFDQIQGTAGLDSLFIDHSRSSMSASWVGGKFVLTDSAKGISHTLDSIERVKFSDSALAVDIEGNGGQVYRLYQAVFGRTPDKQGLGFWMNAMDKGTSLEAVADEFAKSNEFRTIYGSAPSSEAVVTRLYENVLHRQPDQSGFDFWNNHLKANPSLIEAIVVEFSESPENQAQVATIIGNGFEYQPWA